MFQFRAIVPFFGQKSSLQIKSYAYLNEASRREKFSAVHICFERQEPKLRLFFLKMVKKGKLIIFRPFLINGFAVKFKIINLNFFFYFFVFKYMNMVT